MRLIFSLCPMRDGKKNAVRSLSFCPVFCSVCGSSRTSRDDFFTLEIEDNGLGALCAHVQADGETGRHFFFFFLRRERKFFFFVVAEAPFFFFSFSLFSLSLFIQIEQHPLFPIPLVLARRRVAPSFLPPLVFRRALMQVRRRATLRSCFWRNCSSQLRGKKRRGQED